MGEGVRLALDPPLVFRTGASIEKALVETKNRG